MSIMTTYKILLRPLFELPLHHRRKRARSLSDLPLNNLLLLDHPLLSLAFHLFRSNLFQQVPLWPVLIPRQRRPENPE
jgi:hypothetical protein